MGFSDHTSLVDPKAVTILAHSFPSSDDSSTSISRTVTHLVRVDIRANHRIHLSVFLSTSIIVLERSKCASANANKLLLNKLYNNNVFWY